jgi:hypothetical protein
VDGGLGDSEAFSDRDRCRPESFGGSIDLFDYSRGEASLDGNLNHTRRIPSGSKSLPKSAFTLACLLGEINEELGSVRCRKFGPLSPVALLFLGSQPPTIRGFIVPVRIDAIERVLRPRS